MNHNFTHEHFDLLRRWGGHHFDGNPLKVEARATLGSAWDATEAWAAALQKRLFPLGRPKIRKAPINQGQAFTPYTWAKIYPSPSSPKALAYTVGIDEDGFVVKIDTVGGTITRSAYLALRGPDNANSPFGAVLPAGDGLKLSFEQLVEWSAEAIGRFRMGYAEVLERIGLKVPKMSLITEEAKSRQAFADWRRALLEGAVRKGSLFWLLEGGIIIRPTRSAGSPDVDGMDLGIDPTGRRWAVQINDPRIPGDHNSGSAIGVDADGRRFLLRQGLLRPHEPGGHTISGEEFVSRTGLAPVPVEAEDLAARRRWFAVCSLDAESEEMRLATSRFVDRCAAARASADAGEAPLRADRPDLFAAGETGGSYRLPARPATEERIVHRHHGTVWLALAEILAQENIDVRKGRDPLGYEVDAEIDSGRTPPLLVEIKTGISAGEIHGGVGQLHLYPKLIPRLAEYERALLLPRLPAPEVRKAVQACGVAIHTFELVERKGEVPEVTFAQDFLDRCGVPNAG